MNKIKISALAMSFVLTFGTFASAANFSDMPEDPAVAASINNAVKNGLLSGYEDGTVRPDNKIRRSEMAVIITNACKVDKEGDISKFADVKKEDWFYSAMAKAYEMGAFAGDGVNMNPNNNITFQECFTVLSEVFDLLPPYEFLSSKPETIPDGKLYLSRRLYDISVLDKFTDKAEIADWAIPYVSGVVANGGWSGIDGKITPKEHITRAQFAVVMDNLIQNYIDEPGKYETVPAGNTMVRCDDVTFTKSKFDGDLYIGDSVSPNKVTIENVTADRIIIRGCAEPTINKNGDLDYNPENVGITISGTFDAIRVIRPYINVDARDAKCDSPFTVSDTNIYLGNITTN